MIPTHNSLTYGALADFVAMYRAPALVLIGSVNHDKAKELLAKATALQEPYDREFPLLNKTSERLVFACGSEIRAVPARLISARGPTAKLVLLEEAAWTDRDFFQTIYPTMARTGGTIVALSTPPETAEGWWWERWTENGTFNGREAVAGISDHWKRSYVTALEAGHASEEHLAQARLDLPPEVFAREYECQFPVLDRGLHGDRAIPRDAIEAFFAGLEGDAPEARV